MEAQQDRISLSGTVWSDGSAEAAAKLAGLYAKNVVNSVVVRQLHSRQVKLKVQIIEIDRSKLEQFGINLFSQGKNHRQRHYRAVSLDATLIRRQAARPRPRSRPATR